jgi:DNA polymerase-1
MDLLSSMMQQLFQRLHQEKLWDIFYRTEMRLLPLLACMELTGLTVDMGALRTIGEMLTAEAASIEKEAHAVAGKEFNLASAKQVPMKFS